MGRTLLALSLSIAVSVVAVPACAADNVAADTAAEPSPTATVGSIASITGGAPATTKWLPLSRPRVLPALYAGSAGLQAFDAYSTLKGLSRGATEANPLMAGATGNPGVFIGIKAGVTAASILAAEQMWRNHHRVAAVALMAASNSFMAFVAAHNAAVLSAPQR